MKKLFLFIITTAVFLSMPLCAQYKANAQEVENFSKAALLMNYHGGEIIYEKNSNSRLQIASMCKIMTMLLVFEEIDSGNLNFNDQITVSQNAASMGGSQAFLDANSTYKVYDLIKSIVIASANDSCVALAEKISGSANAFVDKMNSRAKELGANDTQFSNCTGLPKPEQYSTAKDVAIMLKALLSHDDYFTFSKIWLDQIKHKNDRVTELTNTNKLIRFYQGCDSGKTGFTSEAGHCLAASATRGGMRLISVVIGAPDGKTRFNQSKEMLNYGFNNYTNRMYIDSQKPLDQKISIRGGKQSQVEIYAKDSFYRFTKRSEKENVELEYTLNNSIKAPIASGTVVGNIQIFANKVHIGTVDVVIKQDVGQKNYGDYLKDITKGWKIAN